MHVSDVCFVASATSGRPEALVRPERRPQPAMTSAHQTVAAQISRARTGKRRRGAPEEGEVGEPEGRKGATVRQMSYRLAERWTSGECGGVMRSRDHVQRGPGWGKLRRKEGFTLWNRRSAFPSRFSAIEVRSDFFFKLCTTLRSSLP